jgi:hypothetical protein
LLRHPPGFSECPSQQHLNVSIEAAELVVGPADQGVMNRRVDSEQDLPALAH